MTSDSAITAPAARLSLDKSALTRAGLWLAMGLPFLLAVIERLPLLLRAVSAIVCGLAVLLGGPLLFAQWIDSTRVPPLVTQTDNGA